MQNSNESKATNEKRRKYNEETPEKVKAWRETTYTNFLEKNGYTVIKNRPARKTYTPEQVEEMREARTTQGRKGCKAVRINMAFSPEVHKFIRTMARVRGESITDFVEHVFKQHMAENIDLYEAAQSFKEVM